MIAFLIFKTYFFICGAIFTILPIILKILEYLDNFIRIEEVFIHQIVFLIFNNHFLFSAPDSKMTYFSEILDFFENWKALP